MSDSDTLLSYLVPKLTNQVENAATDGFGYILRKSKPARDAFNLLLQQGGYAGSSIVRVETQTSYEDGSRPDMSGYDEDDVKRLLVEAKFWATLQEGQASGYLRQFDDPGPAMLLFIAPQARIETLWAEIVSQIQETRGRRLENVEISDALRSADVAGDENRLMLVSWRRLLDHLSASADIGEVEGDIWQLTGLAEEQDSDAFLPVHSEDISPDIGRRILSYNDLAYDVVDLGKTENWLDTKGLRATPQAYGYGRFFRFSGVACVFWIGVNCERWAISDVTPMWLWIVDEAPKSMDRISRALNVRIYDRWIPIHLRKSVEFHAVLDDVASQLKEIGRVIGAKIPDV
ncbi:MAG: hypothetical protein OXR72_06510 [Gemmatimonadota bacterium]|nr:hypothetical protein [Gemmatimonadota bacterium]